MQQSGSAFMLKNRGIDEIDFKNLHVDEEILCLEAFLSG